MFVTYLILEISCLLLESSCYKHEVSGYRRWLSFIFILWLNH